MMIFSNVRVEGSRICTTGPSLARSSAHHISLSNNKNLRAIHLLSERSLSQLLCIYIPCEWAASSNILLLLIKTTLRAYFEMQNSQFSNDDLHMAVLTLSPATILWVEITQFTESSCNFYIYQLHLSKTQLEFAIHVLHLNVQNTPISPPRLRTNHLQSSYYENLYLQQPIQEPTSSTVIIIEAPGSTISTTTSSIVTIIEAPGSTIVSSTSR